MHELGHQVTSFNLSAAKISLLIYGLFNDAASSSNYVVSDGRMIVEEFS
jgi:hypothetical protein